MVLGIRDKENLLSGSSQSTEGQGNPTGCTLSALANEYTGHLAHRCILARKGEKLESKGVRHILDLRLVLRAGKTICHGRADGAACQQEWHSKVLRCVEGMTHSRRAKGEADSA